ncbi:WAS/WASL-interacting protein family member 3-like isoform X2 [Colius striatus]|uniref:WAS/WASL-interacting protein family member 3-like isoform X2 n=1 Tax=Colius striatus TaxID=57412 RepID=UPI002B1E5147|nr:WAS/WASL-interacting protein family member 3-like isoform X2 [Colius striatus]
MSLASAAFATESLLEGTRSCNPFRAASLVMAPPRNPPVRPSPPPLAAPSYLNCPAGVSPSARAAFAPGCRPYPRAGPPTSSPPDRARNSPLSCPRAGVKWLRGDGRRRLRRGGKRRAVSQGFPRCIQKPWLKPNASAPARSRESAARPWATARSNSQLLMDTNCSTITYHTADCVHLSYGMPTYQDSQDSVQTGYMNPWRTCKVY